jgi:hypothetical protein
MTEQKNLAECCSNLPFLNIFKTFRIAIQPARLFTAFLGVAGLFVIGWLMDFSKTVVVSGQLAQRELRTSRLTGAVTWPTELHCFVSDSQRIDDFIKRYKGQAEKQGVFKVWSNFCMTRFNQAAASVIMLKFDSLAVSVMECIAASIWALKYHTAYSIIYLFVSLVVFSITGQAICRGAALQFSRNEIPAITPCLKFSLKKFISVFCAILAPIIFVALFGLVVILLIGLVTNIPWFGEIFLALCFIIILLAGVLMAFVVIWAVAGGNLMFGVIAYENSDAFDAIGRAFIYVYSKPWRFGFYTLLAVVYGAINYLFVRFFAFLTLTISRWFLSIIIWTKASKSEQMSKLDVIWPKPEFFSLLGSGLEISKSATELIAAIIIYLAVLIVAGIVVAFAVSFYFSASTVIYCLLRSKVDNTVISDIFIEAEQTTDRQSEITGQSVHLDQAESLKQPE